MMTFVFLFLASTLTAAPTSAQLVGVCYGMQGNNLPEPSAVVGLYRSNNIGRMRLYGPDQAALRALRNSGIQLIMDVPRTELQSLASDPSAAADWLRANVVAHWPGVRFRYIAVGDKLIRGGGDDDDDAARYVLPAMRNVHRALESAGLADRVKVSTVVDTGVLGPTFPPSGAAFSADATTFLSPIAAFLASTGSPLLVSVYTYQLYISNDGNPGAVSLSYALMNNTVVWMDGSFAYTNAFDSLLDAFHTALKREGAQQLPVVVAETGWPSAGGAAGANAENARTYNQNLIRRAGKGTPARSDRIEAYIYSMFDENQKSPESNLNFGLFSPDMQQPLYPLDFTQTEESESILVGNIQLSVGIFFLPRL